jgi:kinesin family protein 15
MDDSCIESGSQNFVSKESVKVLVRIRPANESLGPCTLLGTSKPNNISVKHQSNQRTGTGEGCYSFNFDNISGQECGQEDIFDEIGQPACEAFLDGYNAAVFAYGQTGSGKTYTMYGEGVNTGIIPRSLTFVFNAIDEYRRLGQVVTCSLSLIEIYNEQVVDLLSNSKVLQLREDTGAVYLEGVSSVLVDRCEQAMNILVKGSERRTVGSTNANASSSRSHSVLTLTLRIEEYVDQKKRTKMSSYHLIDLAGSERQRTSKSSGVRLKEAVHINRSLSALGNVIMALAEGSKHVPYRDSKLTFLLRDSIGGNSKTYMIANINPSDRCTWETVSTLRFASFAKKSSHSVARNVTNRSITLDDLKKEISRLKNLLTNKDTEVPADQPAVLPSSTQGTEHLVSDEPCSKRLQRLLLQVCPGNVVRALDSS